MIEQLREILCQKELKENEELISYNKQIQELLEKLSLDCNTMLEEIQAVYNEHEQLLNEAKINQRSFLKRLFNPKGIKKLKEHIELLEEKKLLLSRCISLFKDRNEIIKKITRLYQEKEKLADFNLSFSELISLADANGITITLSEKDKTTQNNPERYNGLEDFVLVHKTRYIPSGGRIRTLKETGLIHKGFFGMNKVGEYKFTRNRNTLHFSVNSEVGNHGLGNWDNCRYAVVIPFDKMPLENLKSGVVVDTYFEGGIQLPPEAIFLCPKEDIKSVKKQNPNIIVVAYEGQKVSGYANALVGLLGKHVEQATSWEWLSGNDAKYYEMLKKIMPNLPIEPHFNTIDAAREKYFDDINCFIEFIKKTHETKTYFTRKEYLDIVRPVYFSPSTSTDYGIDLIIRQIREELNKIGIILPSDIELQVEEILSKINSEPTNDCLTKEMQKQYTDDYQIPADSISGIYPYNYIDYLIKISVYDALQITLEQEKVIEPEKTMSM
ncbi:MAG: hypothetical protein GX951_04090 [Mollicutes bacterium]|nr:hypothetical protein [Mollicutes bacterium]